MSKPNNQARILTVITCLILFLKSISAIHFFYIYISIQAENNPNMILYKIASN